MITSNSNKQIKALAQLVQKSKARRSEGLYVVEGIRMFREAPADKIQAVYVSESFAAKPENLKALAGRQYEVLADSVYAHVSDTKTPQGILVVLKMNKYPPADILAGNERPLILVLENIQDPGNLGTMFRTGEGAGISGIIMDRNTVDVYNPKTIRSTMGSIYRVPFIIADDLKATVEGLKKSGISVYAAHLEGSVPYDQPDYTKGSAFMIGNEGNGLTAELTKAADKYIRIPMGGQLESLNAAMAAGILMYEANRQRRQ